VTLPQALAQPEADGNMSEPIVMKDVPDEPPPLLRTWPRLYGAVLLYLFFLIVSLYAFMRAFS
jgi:hypothetical protein